MTTATAEIERADSETLRVRLGGSWKLGSEIPSSQGVLTAAGSDLRRITLDGTGVTDGDTGLLAFLLPIIQASQERRIETVRDKLPDGAWRLLDLALAVPEKEVGRDQARLRPLGRLGQQGIAAWRGAVDTFTFLGEVAFSFGRLLRGRARFRRSDLALAIQEAGVEALGIVSLISFLVGLILAFMGAMQLQLFGAEIYVASLVAIGSAREIAPLMTGIIMAGRTGASYAAQLGTMTVNEEVDALRALGFSPMDFLVLPRMIALMVMMPLLTIYANLLSILGGFVIGTGVLGIAPRLYWNQTVQSVAVGDFSVGVFKASILGVLIAVAGCMRGRQCGRSASAVGLATTSAVVTGIVAIVVTEALFALIFQVLGI